MALLKMILALGVATLAALPAGADEPAKYKVPAGVVEKIKAALPDKAPAQPKRAHKVLIFTKTNDFRHASIPVGVTALTLMGEKTGAYTTFATEDEGIFEPGKLNQFDAVIMLNTTGDILRPKKL